MLTEGYRQTLNLTIADAMCYSHGVHAIASASVAGAPSYTEQERKDLQQEFSLEKGASEQENPKKNICQKIQEGFARLKTLKAKESEAPLDCFPEVRPNLSEKPSAGVQYIRKASKNLLVQMIQQGRSQKPTPASDRTFVGTNSR